MAGRLAELSRRRLRGNFRAFDPAQSRIVSVEAADGLLRGDCLRLSRLVSRDLERLGVEVRTSTRVVGVDADGVDITTDSNKTEQRVPARTKI